MLIPISQAAHLLGVSIKTLRRWDGNKKVVASRTAGGHRRYDLDAVEAFLHTHVYDPSPLTKSKLAAIYARVSGNKQREDLARQVTFFQEKAKQ